MRLPTFSRSRPTFLGPRALLRLRSRFRIPQLGLGSDFIDDLVLLAAELASEAEFDERMERICFRTRSLLRCDRSSIFLLDGEYYLARFNSGNPPDVAKRFPKHRVRMDDSLIARAVENRRPLLLNHALNDPLMSEQTARIAGIRAIVVAPIFDEQLRPLGFITAEFNETTSTFRNKETRLFEAIANLVGLSIKHHVSRLQREKVESSLQAASQLAALGRFAGGLAHDFNNRLTAIVGISDLLIEQNRGTAIEADLEELVRSVEGAAELTGHLLDMSRGAVKNTEGCDLAFAFRSLESLLRPLVPANIDLLIESTLQNANVLLPRLDLDRILTNLVVNAVDACGAGDTICVRLSRKTTVSRAVSNSNEAEDSEAMTAAQFLIEVIDTGEGISAREIEQVTAPFYTTRAQGMGLGLSIVRVLAEQAEGSVDVQSKLGQGTVVRVSLPESVVASIDRVEVEPEIPRDDRALRILVVEDDEAVRRILVRALSDHGYHVAAAGNGVDALEIAAQASDSFDVLSTDLAMPEMDGIELARNLKSTAADLKVIFISAYSPDRDLAAHRDFEDALFIAKPFSPARVIKELALIPIKRAFLH